MRSPLRDVQKTALGVAVVRAYESARTDRLFDDPYAQAFVDAAPGVFADETEAARKAGDVRQSWGAAGSSSAGVPGAAAALGVVFAAHAVVRTRFFDDYLTAASQECTQVVLLAAGLDTRAFRLAWPEGTRLFEVDLPGVLAFKDEVLAARGAVARCARTALAADLRSDWPTALTAAGFSPAVPTAWLAEGLLTYLTAEDAERLLAQVTALSAPGSRLSFEHSPMAAGALLATAERSTVMRRYTALWKGGLGEDAPDRLVRHGWEARVRDIAAVARSYGRPLPDAARGGFLTAVRAWGVPG